MDDLIPFEEEKTPEQVCLQLVNEIGEMAKKMDSVLNLTGTLANFVGDFASLFDDITNLDSSKTISQAISNDMGLINRNVLLKSPSGSYLSRTVGLRFEARKLEDDNVVMFIRGGEYDNYPKQLGFSPSIINGKLMNGQFLLSEQEVATLQNFLSSRKKLFIDELASSNSISEENFYAITGLNKTDIQNANAQTFLKRLSNSTKEEE